MTQSLPTIIVLILALIASLFNVISSISHNNITGGKDIRLNKSAVAVILPCQLFSDPVPADKYIIIEDPIYFTKFKFHKLKLVFHRATMKYYEKYLLDRKLNVEYVDFEKARDAYSKLVGQSVIMYDHIDKHTEMSNYDIKPNIIPTPYFLNTKSDLEYYKTTKSNSAKYSHDKSFYPWMRRKLNILVKDNEPLFSQWSFDKENRNPFLRQTETIPRLRNSAYIKEAREYVLANFPDSFGSDEHFIYPSTHDEAKQHLHDFIKNKLDKFGEFQDAAKSDIVFGYHSVISSSLNTGLLTPRDVLDAITKIKITRENIPSIEGFVRQIIGWREYCHMLYYFESENMRKSNYFNATRKLGSQWWSAETGLIPIDDIIKRVHRYAYAHHIERLMYLAAPMMMCGVSPDEMYNWFISVVSIDAYDWVMVPNIYGMGSFADGGKMMSRPYFSSGKYISKMSNWNDEKTITLWTNLFYNFIGENIPQMKANYYTSRYVNNYNNKSDREKNIIKDSARKFIELVTV